MGRAPVKSFREGGVEVAIWHSMRDGKNQYSCKIKRTYKKDDEWIDTEFLNQREVPFALAVLQRAYSWMAHNSDRGQDGKTQPASKPPNNDSDSVAASHTTDATAAGVNGQAVNPEAPF